MGDRANIVIRQQDQAIYLYSHWGGEDMPDTLARALIHGQSRWNDETYLARIIFNAMTAGDETSTTGFGIGVYPSDNGHPFLVVDSERGTVSVHPEDAQLGQGEWPEPIRSFSFSEYSSEPRTWETVL